MIEQLCEIETGFKNTLARLTGAQMSSIHEKKGRKSRYTLPLRHKEIQYYYVKGLSVILLNFGRVKR